MGEERSESELFQRVRARLRAQVGEDVFNSWFARLELEEIVDDVAHLSVPTRFLCSWIQSNYADRFSRPSRPRIPAIARLHFTVRVNGQARPRLENRRPRPSSSPRPSRCRPQPSRSATIAAPRGDALSGSALDPKMTFDNFVPGATNEIALGVAKQVAQRGAQQHGELQPGLYPFDRRPRQIASAQCHRLGGAARPSRARNIVYLTADHFMYHFITAVQRQSAHRASRTGCAGSTSC